MNNMQKNSLKEELSEHFSDLEKMEPELFRNFITYWLMRKENSLETTSSLKQIKDSQPAEWFNLIQSNQKFRATYGEDTADKLIKVIEGSCS